MSTENYKFDSIGNFRRLPGTKLFRSARPDKASKQDVDKFLGLGIKRILDLRTCRESTKEYANCTGEKLLDDIYQPYLLEIPNKKSPGKKFCKIDKKGRNMEDGRLTSSLSSVPQAHILFDLTVKCTPGFVKDYPFFIKWFAIFLFMLDKLTGKLWFFQFITWYSINPNGMVGHYKDIVNYSGENICTALKFFSEEENVPASFGCTLGKDRTGVMAALILALLGTDKCTIAQDYAHSQEFYDLYIGDLVFLFKLVYLSKEFGDAKYDTMAQLLDYIDQRYGSVPGYLKTIGFNENDQQKLINNVKL